MREDAFQSRVQGRRKGMNESPIISPTLWKWTFLPAQKHRFFSNGLGIPSRGDRDRVRLARWGRLPEEHREDITLSDLPCDNASPGSAF